MCGHSKSLVPLICVILLHVWRRSLVRSVYFDICWNIWMSGGFFAPLAMAICANFSRSQLLPPLSTFAVATDPPLDMLIVCTTDGS